jgi:hypothetical protein
LIGVYYFFDSKEDLGLAVSEWSIGQGVQMLARGNENADLFWGVLIDLSTMRRVRALCRLIKVGQ